MEKLNEWIKEYPNTVTTLHNKGLITTEEHKLALMFHKQMREKLEDFQETIAILSNAYEAGITGIASESDEA